MRQTVINSNGYFIGGLQWIDLWPDSGSDDGRLYLAVGPNEGGYARTATINIVVGGKVVRQMTVNQQSSLPHLATTSM